MDAKTTFLNANLDEMALFMELPKGLWSKGSSSRIYRLQKAIYGLKQFGCIWYIKIDRFLQEQGMIKSVSNHNLCICKNEGLCVVIVSYVDDLFTNKG